LPGVQISILLLPVSWSRMANQAGRRVVEDFAAYGRAVRAIAQPNEDWQRQIEAIELPEEEELDDLDDSPVFRFLIDNGGMETFTNLLQNVVEDIWHQVDPIMAAERRRGPKPLTTTMDHLVLYLMWLKTGTGYDLIAKTFRISETRLEDCLNRVRPALHTALRSRWWDRRRRPVRQPNAVSPLVALIVDGHTTPICQPKMPYEDAKVYWDGKNHIYGLKTEIAISARSPHYCLFTCPAVPASKHDYELHKEIYRQYMGYLRMTPEEMIQNEAQVEHAYWLIMGDKGYVGPADDTHPIERVVPKKGTLTEADRQRNISINRERVVVEQYLGRLAKLWSTMSRGWRWDHGHFDIDFEIACMLTNEHITTTRLDDEDATFYKQLLESYETTHLVRRAKRTAAARNSRHVRNVHRATMLGLEAVLHQADEYE